MCVCLSVIRFLEPFPITRLDNGTGALPGYNVMRDVNLNELMSLRLKRPIDRLVLSRPAVSPLGRHIAVASEDPDEKEHFFMIVDTDRFEKSEDPIVKFCQPNHHVRDIHWIQPGSILVAADKFVQLYSVDDSFNIKCTTDGSADPIHTVCIREMAVSPYALQHAASVGKTAPPISFRRLLSVCVCVVRIRQDVVFSGFGVAAQTVDEALYDGGCGGFCALGRVEGRVDGQCHVGQWQICDV